MVSSFFSDSSNEGIVRHLRGPLLLIVRPPDEPLPMSPMAPKTLRQKGTTTNSKSTADTIIPENFTVDRAFLKSRSELTILPYLIHQRIAQIGIANSSPMNPMVPAIEKNGTKRSAKKMGIATAV